jgi:hypothetical protein
MSRKKPLLKLLVLGDSGVGKTSLMNQVCALMRCHVLLSVLSLLLCLCPKPILSYRCLFHLSPLSISPLSISLSLSLSHFNRNCFCNLSVNIVCE